MSRTVDYDCPICGQYMDFIATTYRNDPYIDGKCYKRMCFCCAHAPATSVQTYDTNGVIQEDGPFFDHEHLRTAEDLVAQGSAESLDVAARCLRGVRRAIKEAGAVALRKLKLKPPEQEYEFNPEYEQDLLQKALKNKGLKKKRRSDRTAA